MSFKKAAGVSLTLCFAAIFGNGAWAEQETLKSVAQKAILNNPEVLQKWHTYQASANEREVARGGYFPRLDAAAGSGRETRDDPFMRKSFGRTSSSLTLTQMLYDGFATRNEVRRLDHARQVRYFELLESSENTALEAARAYLDVLRYRKLVELAEENYARHKALFEQIQQKANAGVARRVDLEQATGRLALAAANLLTETSNLHDVSARYQRVVGELPPQQLTVPEKTYDQGIPAVASELLQTIQYRNPSIQAAIENVRAADAAVDARKAAFQPRVDLRFRNDWGTDLNGYLGKTDNQTAEVIMSWNILNGLSDVARSRQYADLYNAAKDVRDKTCRDIRQTVAIAYNDRHKLSEQLVYLEQHRNSTGKARDAYRKQFDIGQRTLLDLLDTENEYFQSKRAYVSAEHELEIARLRTQAGMGNLLKALDLTRIAKEDLPDMAQWSPNSDSADNCPPESPAIYTLDTEALGARAAEILRESMPEPQAPAPQLVVPTPPAAALPAVASTPSASNGASLAKTEEEREVMLRLKAWEQAWAERDVITYIRLYSQRFIQERKGNWVEERKRVIKTAGSIRLTFSDMKLKTVNKDTVVVSFKQLYQSPNYHDVVTKTLEWQRFDQTWLIVKEFTSQVHTP